ncbi:MAG: SH3 domain-containing protein [Syntrophus sp. (in: bacteria)]
MFRYKFIMICLSLLSILLLNATADAQKVMSVQVKESYLRATPSHLGKIVAKASYGDRVTVFAEQGDWKKVSLTKGKNQGWMHNSSLTSKQIVLKAGQSNVATSVSRDEIALAGKGFSDEVEAQYRKNNKTLDYAWINRMEAFTVSPKQMGDFVSSGQLVQGTEGGKP